MEVQWFYARDGRQVGPVSEAELRGLARQGLLRGDDLVWRAGMEEWSKARAAGFGAAVEPPPPPPAIVPPPLPEGSSPPTSPMPAARRQRQTPRYRARDSQWFVWAGIGVAALLICGLFAFWSARKPRLAERESSRQAKASIVKREGDAARQATARSGQYKEDRQPTQAPGESRAVHNSASHDSAANPSSNVEPAAAEPAPTPDSPEEPAAVPATEPRRANSNAGSSAVPALPAAEPTDSPPSAARLANTSTAEMSKPLARQTVYQRIDVQRQPTFSIQGLTTPQNIHYRLSSKLTVEPAADGSRTVTQVVEDAKLLAADDLSRANFAKSLDELKRRQFTYKLNSRGDVVEFTGYEKNLASLPVDLASGNGFMVTSVIDEDGWKELAELTFLSPKLDAQPGETWKRQMAHDWGPLGSWSGATTFSWARANGNDATAQRIDYKHEMTYGAPAAGEGDLPFKIKAANFTVRQAAGSITYDRTKQRVSTVEEIFDVGGSVSVDLLGTALPIELTERQQITIRLSEQRLPDQQN